MCLFALSKLDNPNDLKHTVFRLQFEQISIFINQEFFSLYLCTLNSALYLLIKSIIMCFSLLRFQSIQSSFFFYDALELTKVVHLS